MQITRPTDKTATIDLDAGDAVALTFGKTLIQIEIIGSDPSLLTVDVQPLDGADGVKIIAAASYNRVRVSAVELPAE